jgi:hypothetical protein
MATERKKLSSEGIFLPKKAKERNVMSNSNNNRINIPQAKQAMEQFKMQAAQEVGVNLTNGYNGHLTSREAGSVGGQMVKKMCPVRIAKFDRNSRTAEEYIQKVVYVATITI